MNVYPCPYLEEIVILCDGRVTTCCVDSVGANTYANIYTHGAENVLQLYNMVRQKYIEDYRQIPRCKVCVESQLRGGGFIKSEPLPQEVDKFIKNGYTGRYVIELTAVCNLKCIGCIQSHNILKQHRIDGNLFIDMNRLIQWMNPIVQSIRNVRLYNYGETFLHPDSLDFCYYLTHRTAFGADIHVSTNGYLLDSKQKNLKLLKAQLNALIFSIHGGTQESLEKYMTKAANLEKVMKIMKEILQMRRELGLFLPRIYWKCLLFEWNDSDYEMDMVRQLAEDVGVDGYYFELAAAPYPSKRFTTDSEEWRMLSKNGKLFKRDKPEYEGAWGKFFQGMFPDYFSIESEKLKAKELTLQGNNFLAQNDFNSALEVFSKALEADKNYAPAHNNVAILYWRIGEIQKSIEHMIKAIQINPKEPDRQTIVNYANMLKELNKLYEAKIIYSGYLQEHPEDKEISELLKIT